MSSHSFISRLSIAPICRTMFRQKYAVLMLIFQISIALAVLSNGLFIAFDRYQKIKHTSGIDELNTFFLTSSGFTDNFNARNSIQSDLASIRALPDVIDAVKTNSFPYSDNGFEFALTLTADKNQQAIRAANYKLDEHGIEAFGLKLIAGEYFNQNEVIWQSENDMKFPTHVILSARTANALFNTQDWPNIIGKAFYIQRKQLVIVKGIVQKLHAPWEDWEHRDYSFISPAIVTHNSSRYFIRVKPGALQYTMKEVENMLALSNKERLIRKMQTTLDAKKTIYGADIAAVTILSVVIISLTIIVGLGLAGATGLKVLKQTKQIGIRRALGANKLDILRYFLLENMLITTLGVCIGVIIAIALNLLLVQQYAFEKLPLTYMVVGACLIYLLSIVATIKPIIKAVNISPIAATQGN